MLHHNYSIAILEKTELGACKGLGDTRFQESSARVRTISDVFSEREDISLSQVR